MSAPVRNRPIKSGPARLIDDRPSVIRMRVDNDLDVAMEVMGLSLERRKMGGP